jgi:hypothetical protein
MKVNRLIGVKFMDDFQHLLDDLSSLTGLDNNHLSDHNVLNPLDLNGNSHSHNVFHPSDLNSSYHDHLSYTHDRSLELNPISPSFADSPAFHQTTMRLSDDDSHISTSSSLNISDTYLSPHQNFDSNTHYDHQIGHPQNSISNFEPQQFDNTCVIAVEHSIIAEQTGQNISQTTLYQESINDHVLTDQGIPGIFAPLELSHHGVSAVVHPHGAIADLETLVSHGESVMIPVDGQYLAHSDSGSILHNIESPVAPHHADHVVQFTGTLEIGGNTYAVVNDPAVPHGTGQLIPEEQFQTAWDQSGDMYIATNMHEHDQDFKPDFHGTDIMAAFGTRVDHYHHLVRSSPNWDTGSGEPDSMPPDGGYSSSDSDSSSSSDSGSSCTDSDGDGICD